MGIRLDGTFEETKEFARQEIEREKRRQRAHEVAVKLSEKYTGVLRERYLEYRKAHPEDIEDFK